MPMCKTCKSVVGINEIFGDKCINCISQGDDKDLLKVERLIKEEERKNIDSQIEKTKIELSKAYPNHILHLLLSLVTAGLWIVIWIFASISADKKRKSLQKKLDKLYKEKTELNNTYKKEEDIKTSHTLGGDNIDKLSKLSAMLEKGHITKEEFETQKDKLLT